MSEEKIHVEGCPFCGEDLKQDTEDGEKIWRHPQQFYPTDPPEPVTPEDSCIFTGYYLLERDLPKWNHRAKQTRREPARIQVGTCSRCGSATPSSFSEICGYDDCPQRGTAGE